MTANNCPSVLPGIFFFIYITCDVNIQHFSSSLIPWFFLKYEVTNVRFVF